MGKRGDFLWWLFVGALGSALGTYLVRGTDWLAAQLPSAIAAFDYAAEWATTEGVDAVGLLASHALGGLFIIALLPVLLPRFFGPPLLDFIQGHPFGHRRQLRKEWQETLAAVDPDLPRYMTRIFATAQAELGVPARDLKL